MQRIYLPYTQFGEQLIISEKELYHQVTRVMRARVGQEFIFFDGLISKDYIYVISSIDAQKVEFLLKEIILKKSELFPQLYLYQALPNKIEKIEYIIQKSCEVGYHKIIFFEAERSQILVLSENKKERFKKIAIEAIEQCGGNIVPEIDFIQHISEMYFGNTIPKDESELSLFCHTVGEDSKHISELSYQGVENIYIFIGPEGGFSPQEVERFEIQGNKRIYFGERIFRCETVAPLIGFYISQKKEA